MNARIQKWGTGLAVRIPRSLADEAGLKAGSVVDIVAEGGKLDVAPVPRPRYSLDELVRGITKQNRHAEVDTGGIGAGAV